jgi:hypothetical protein
LSGDSINEFPFFKIISLKKYPSDICPALPRRKVLCLSILSISEYLIVVFLVIKEYTSISFCLITILVSSKKSKNPAIIKQIITTIKKMAAFFVSELYISRK